MIDALCRCGNATRQRTCRLSGIDGGLVHEHDRDVVFNGIDTAALGALKGLSFVLKFKWLLAERADEKIEEFLRDHAKILAGAKRESQIGRSARRQGGTEEENLHDWPSSDWNYPRIRRAGSSSAGSPKRTGNAEEKGNPKRSIFWASNISVGRTG